MNRRLVLLSGAALVGAAGLHLPRATGFAAADESNADSAAPSGRLALGMNLTPIVYFTPNVFLDRMKASSTWETYGKPATTDAYGYPQSLDGRRLITTMVPCEAGRYALLFDGDLDARLQGAVIRSRSRGRVVFEVNSLPGSFRQLILDAIRKPPTTIRLVREDQEHALLTGEIFAPDFLEQVRGFKTLRFMDWMRTNSSPFNVSYTDVRACSYERGVPIEIIAALVRKVGAAPWICIPHLATERLTRQMLEAIRPRAAGAPAPFVEFSNEVWNLQFGQAKYAASQANTLGPAASGGNWYGYQAGKLALLARGSGCRVVLGCQTAVPERAAQVWDGVRQAGARASDFAAWMIATYVTGTLTAANGPTLALAARNDIAGAIANVLGDTTPGSSSVASMARIYAAHGRIAAQHGLELVAYEGNLHLNALPVFAAQQAAVRPFFEAIVRDPASARLMDANLEAFAAAGGRLACLYNLSSAPGPFGAFGLVDSGSWNLIRRRLAIKQ